MMDCILHTDRLILRPLQDCDLDFLIEMHTNPDVMRFTPPVKSKEQVVNGFPHRITEAQSKPYIGAWVIFLKETNTPIGTTGMFELPLSDPEIDPVQMTGKIEIGYRSIPLAWGKGYITEAAKRLLDFVFDVSKLDEIVACAHPENEASKNILRKIGLSDLGTTQCYGQELPYFEITREQWSARKKTNEIRC